MRASNWLGVLVGSLSGLAAMSMAASAEEQPVTESAPAAANAPETTPPPAQATQNAPSQQKDKDDEIVCKKEPAPIGSRIGSRKVCRTVAEWRRIQAVAKETTDEIQNRKVPPPAS